MADLVIWALIVLGLAYLGTAAAITTVPRRFVYLLLPKRARGVLECAPCFSFWTGAALGAFRFVPVPWIFPVGWQGNLIAALVGGVLGVAVVACYQGATGWYIAEYDKHVGGDS